MSKANSISREFQLMLAALGLPLLWEGAAVADKGARALPFLACSLAIAAVTLLTRQKPLAGALICAPLVVGSAVLMPTLNYFAGYPRLAYLPVTQLVAVMALIVLLVRRASPARSATGVGALTIAAGGAATIGYIAAHNARAVFITSPAMAAGIVTLALGTALAAGIYARQTPVPA
jgi:hypothetical protein